jgi:hypothetical protein
MGAKARITHAQRRARLVARHHLRRTAGEVPEAVRAVVALHSSDPITPYLAAWARVPAFATGDLDRCLLESRELWRLHAMRRTLFVVPASEAPIFDAAAAREVARTERRKLEGWLKAEMDPRRVSAFLRELEARVLEALADGGEQRTEELSAQIPELATPITLGSGKWAARSPLSSRLLCSMAMDGRVVRTRSASWRSSQYRWAATPAWFGHPGAPMDPPAARLELARRYLAAYGPVTQVDLRWWTGWTAKQTVAAAEALGAELVVLEGGGEGLVLPDDTGAVEKAGPQVALLPGLDPTSMGWKERGWYLGGHQEALVDRSGNIGPTVWVGGRVAGGWAQRPGGEVVYRLLDDVGKQAAQRVAAEAAALAEWLGGVTVTPRFRTPLERELAGA